MSRGGPALVAGVSRIALLASLSFVASACAEPTPGACEGDCGFASSDLHVDAVRCGDGSGVIEFGQGYPYRPMSGNALPILMGAQGGFHLEVSLRADADMDPDHADVLLIARIGNREVSRHLSRDTLLIIGPEGCDYPSARLVLVDEAKLLLTSEGLPELVREGVTVSVSLTSPAGSVEGTRHFEVLAPVGEDELPVPLLE